ncbi:MAG: glycosyltransferase family 2 protein [Ignavibacteria bacterium]|jgi:GT2 family glycosyltransferase
MNEPVSVIILNYNGRKYLKDCLTSVLAQSYSEFEIIFFDNASSDGSAEFLTETFSDQRIKIIESKENLSFAGGNNEAIKYTRHDLIALLNNDTVVDKDWLSSLVRSVEEKNTIASSYVITKGIDPKYYETNGSVSYLMYNVMNIFENIEDEFYPNGCSVIFRKSEIPVPFDGDYFFYSEDLYLGLLSRFMGMKVRFVKDSLVQHLGGGTLSCSFTKTFYLERNRLLNLYTFFSVSFIIKISPLICLTNSAKALHSLFSRSVSFRGIVKAHFWLYFHIPLIIRKRNALKKIQRVDEREIIKFMTSKLLNHEKILPKIINNISYTYSRMVGFKPIEYFQKRKNF